MTTERNSYQNQGDSFAFVAGVRERMWKDRDVPTKWKGPLEIPIWVKPVKPDFSTMETPGKLRRAIQTHDLLSTHVSSGDKMSRIVLEVHARELTTALGFGRLVGESVRGFNASHVGDKRRLVYTTAAEVDKVKFTESAVWEMKGAKNVPFQPAFRLVMYTNENEGIDWVEGLRVWYPRRDQNLQMQPAKAPEPFNFGNRWDQMKYLNLLTAATIQAPDPQ